MKLNGVKFDWDDISIIPSILSDVNSRSEIKLEKLPLMVSPMDTVVDKFNANKFIDIGYEVCLPRGSKNFDVTENVKKNSEKCFISFGLEEIIDIVDGGGELPGKVLIDIANGHMRKLYNVSKKIKKNYKNVILMVGNIANPETYRMYSEIGVDFLRIGIGGGSACITSANGGVHYPMASLINECYKISCGIDTPSKIVADGGFKTYSDIIKALALGADYVQLGSILNKTIESCSTSYIEKESGYVGISNEEAINFFKSGVFVYKYFRGMSTKEVQKTWKLTDIKTAEGITMYNKVEYTLSGWTENFTDYLKTNMSYCGKRNLKEYVGNVEFIMITQNAFKRFNK